MKKYHCISILSLAFVLPLNGHSQNFYKWVDANGSTHYTTTPPPKHAKKLGSVNTFDDTPSDQNTQASTPTQDNKQTTNSPDQNPSSTKNNNGDTQSIPLPPPQTDPTSNQPIVIGQGNATL